MSQNLVQGEGWAYDHLVSENVSQLNGAFAEPLAGIVSGILNESGISRTLTITIERLDIGLPPMADLNVIPWGPGRVSPGQTITYTIHYRNVGLINAKNVAVYFALAPHLSYVSSSESFFDDESNEVRMDLGDLLPGESRTIFVKSTVQSGLPSGTQLDTLTRVSTTSKDRKLVKLDTTSWRSNIQNGDIILVADPLSPVRVTGDYTHTGIFVDHYTDSRTGQTYFGDFVIEAIPNDYVNGVNQGGVVATDISHFDFPNKVEVAIYRVADLTDNERQDIINFVSAQIGKDYEALKDFFNPDGPIFHPDGNIDAEKWYCTELVWAAVLYATRNRSEPINLNSAIWGLAISPDEIAKSVYTTYINGFNLYDLLKDIFGGSWSSIVTVARDPNFKFGPEGGIEPNQKLNYTIEFENEGEGTAFGVYFTDTLDLDLNDSTIQINPVINKNNNSVIAPPGIYNPATRTITWFVGEVDPGQGGYTNISMNVRNDVPDRTAIINYATVYFPSVPEETRTNAVVSVVEISPPIISNVAAAYITKNSSVVSWTTDDESDSLVKYGTEPGNFTHQVYSPLNVTMHTITLYNLDEHSTYYFVVNSTDQVGHSNESSVYNFTTTQNQPPTANFSYVINDRLVSLNASASFDFDGEITSYHWNFGDGTNGIGMIVNHTYLDSGNYTITLTVTDNDGANGSTTKQIIIINQQPNVPNNPSPIDGANNVSINTNLTWSGGDPDLGNNVTYDVYFGTTSLPLKMISNQTGNSYNPFGLEYGTTYYWKIVAWDNHGASTAGPVWNFTTILDIIPPVTIIYFNGTVGDNDWYTTPVLVSLVAIDSQSGVNETMYKLDGGNWINYTAPFMVSNDGNHTISYYSVDEVGNAETVKSTNLKIDKIVPVTTHTFSGTIGNNSWYISNVTITLSVTDTGSGVNHTYYQIDNGSWNIYVSPIVVSIEDTHTLNYYSIDKAGNMEPIKGPFLFKIDKTKPITTHQLSGTIGDNNWYTSSVTITLTATDSGRPIQMSGNPVLVIGKGPSGVNSTYYKIDAGAWIKYSIPFSVSADGSHNLSYYSIDYAGNTESVKGPFSFKIDQTAPTITLTVTALNPAKTKWLLDANVIDATSGLAKVAFYIDDSLQGNISAPGPYQWTYQGSGKIAKAIVFDAAGNSKESAEVTVYIDELSSQSQKTPSMGYSSKALIGWSARLYQQS